MKQYKKDGEAQNFSKRMYTFTKILYTLCSTIFLYLIKYNKTPNTRGSVL